MESLSQNAAHFFKECGRRGGRKRAKGLSRVERSLIASRAAHARWRKNRPALSMPSVRLDQPLWDSPAFLEEILLEGSLDRWRELYRKVFDQPFGPVAEALEKTLSSAKIYGATPLWKGILRTVQGNFHEEKSKNTQAL